MTVLSILIPTLVERQAQLARLESKLRAQIVRANLHGQVDLEILCDNREQTLGEKRNRLIAQARGEFIAFVDDDDDVCENYVTLVYRALQEHPNVDCLGITGLVYFRGIHPHRFIYSLQYNHYFSKDGVYYRPPYTLNPVRREIVRQFPFAQINYNEDIDWAIRVANARALRHEFMIDQTLYYYYCRTHWLYQWGVDITEPIRHPLGLQFVNRLRVAQWINSHLKGIFR